MPEQVALITGTFSVLNQTSTWLCRAARQHEFTLDVLFPTRLCGRVGIRSHRGIVIISRR